LSDSVHSNGSLTFLDGILHTGSYKLTLPGAAASVSGAGTNKFVDGNLMKTISGCTSVNFEVGNYDYTPVLLNLSSAGTGGRVGVQSVSGMCPGFSASGFPTSNCVNNYWIFNNYSAAGPSSATPSFIYNFADIVGGSNIGFAAREYTSSSWSAAMPATNTTAPYTTSVTSGVALSALAGDYAVGNACTDTIAGNANLCSPGDTATLSNSISGGAWSSSNPAVATISSAGLITAVSPGYSVVVYTTASCSISKLVTVGSSSITGSSLICPSSVTTMTDTIPGGAWSSSNPLVATINSFGVVNSVGGGSTIISYTLGACAPATFTLSVTTMHSVTGRTLIFSGTADTLYDSTTGGEWSSSDTLLASVTSAGIVHAINYGTPVISYTVGTCSELANLTIIGLYHIIADSFAYPPDTLCTTPSFFVQANGYDPHIKVKTWYGDGSMDSSLLVALDTTGYSTVYHSYYSPGSYSIKQVLCWEDFPLDSIMYTYHHPFCKTFYTRFYFDLAADCLMSGGDPLNQVPVQVVVDSDGVIVDTITATSGVYYTANGAPGTGYGFRLLSDAFNTTCFPAETWHDTISASAGFYAQTNVGLICSSTANYDLSIHSYVSCGRFASYFYVIADNLYCTPENATLAVNFSPKYGYDAAYPDSPAVSGTTMSWISDSLSSENSSRFFWGYLNAIAPPLTVGDTANTSMIITPTLGDVDTLNNYVSRVDTIMSSFDPNIMDVSPKGCFPLSDSLLTFTVVFENTGNDTAHNIYVMDTLPNSLDMHSLRLLAVSKPMDIALFSNGGYNIARFDFHSINLLDSSHHGACTGMFVFTIKPATDLASGTLIHNRAGIYFDDNSVVITNQVTENYGCLFPAKVNTLSNGFELYPNPAHNNLMIRSANLMHKIVVTDLIGREILTTSADTKFADINTTALIPGIYIVKIDGTVAGKFVKE